MKKRATLFSLLSSFAMMFLVTASNGQQGNGWSEPAREPCYQGLKVSVRNFGEGAGGYLWGVKFRNDYDRPVRFDYKLTLGEQARTRSGYLTSALLKQGEVWSNEDSKLTALLFKTPSDDWTVHVQKVCFDGFKCGGADDCYASCDVTPEKANQGCGLSSADADNPSSEKNSSGGQGPTSRQTAPAKSGGSEAGSLGGEWERDDKAFKVNVAMTVDGLNWTTNVPKTMAFKKISADTYRLEEGRYYYILKVVGENRLAYWNNGLLESYWNRKGAPPAEKVAPKQNVPSNTTTATAANQSSADPTGTWTGDNGLVVKIVISGASFYVNVPGEANPYLFKLTSGRTYRFDDGSNFCTVTFLSNDRLDYSCNGNHLAFFNRNK